MKKSIKLAALSVAILVGYNAKSQSTIASNTLTGSQYLGSANNMNVDFKANNIQWMRLTPVGNFGIGTTTPQTKLHVTGAALFATSAGVPVSAPEIFAKNGFSTASFADYSWYGNPTCGIFHPANNVIGLTVSGFEKFRVHSNGFVGINCPSPTAQLTVNGNVLIGDPANVTLPAGYKLYVQTGILAERVKVALINTTDWADYVFAKNYKLKPLTEVAKFVEENKHLPGVPSAEELKEQGGFDIVKMDAKLLEKIEELTLYVIELNKQNKELTERLEKLEEKNKF